MSDYGAPNDPGWQPPPPPYQGPGAPPPPPAGPPGYPGGGGGYPPGGGGYPPGGGYAGGPGNPGGGYPGYGTPPGGGGYYGGASPQPGGSGGGKGSGLLIGAIIIGVLVIIGAGVGIGVVLSHRGSDNSADPAPVTTSSTPAPVPTESTAPPTVDPTSSATDPAPPTTSNPPPSGDGLGLGQSGTVDKYSLTLVKIDKNADQIIKDENQFNEAPSGQYVLATWKVVYNGSGKGEPGSDINTTALAAGGEYNDYECGAVVPDPKYGITGMAPGDSATFTTCFDVPTNSLDLLTYSASTFNNDDPPVVWTP